jgi:hypothetical protein
MFRLKWACNLRVQHGVDILRPPVRATRIAAQVVVGKGVHGVAVVTNGVGEGQERAPARTQAGTRRVLVGIQAVVAVAVVVVVAAVHGVVAAVHGVVAAVHGVVAAVHGVVHPTGIFEFCTLQGVAVVHI